MLSQAFDDGGFVTSRRRLRHLWCTMTPKEIVEEFAHSLNKVELIIGQLSESELTRLREAVAPLLLQISYDKTGAVQILIGLIPLDAAYVACYGEAIPEITRVMAYNNTIDDNATAFVRARTKTAHKAKYAGRAEFKTARRETNQFILAVIANTWV